MHALKEAGFQTITLRDMKRIYEGEEIALPEKPIMVTFDDGYLSNYEIAFPLLKKLEMHATIFTIVERRDNNHPNHFLWEKGKDMLDSEWIDIQSHTYDHHYFIDEKDNYGPALTTMKGEESFEEYRLRISRDLCFAKERMEAELGTGISALAFPYGAYSNEVVSVARECGYELLFTGESRLNGENNIKEGILHRLPISKDISGEDLVRKLENM